MLILSHMSNDYLVREHTKCFSFISKLDKNSLILSVTDQKQKAFIKFVNIIGWGGGVIYKYL